MSGIIESPDNPKVKEAARLRDRRWRKRTGRFLVEGVRELERALDAGHRAEVVFLEEEVAGAAGAAIAARAELAGARVLRVSPRAYGKLAVREGGEGLLAVLPVPDASLDRLRPEKDPLLLACGGVEKPGNLGALLRTADAFGVAGVLVQGGTDLWNPNAVRASLGSLFAVPVAEVEPGALGPWLHQQGIRLAAAVPEGGIPPADADLRGGVALLLGAEGTGLPPGERDAADLLLQIPMRGLGDSLNVSVAAGILLYEADRQRRVGG